MYHYLTKSAPLSVYNLLNLYRLTLLRVTISTPFFLGIFGLLVVIFYTIIRERSKRFDAPHAFILLLFSLNPYIINLVCNDITGLLVSLVLLTIFKGIVYLESKRSARGVFLIASGLAMLVASVEIGITVLVSIILFFPFLLKRFFRERQLLGVYLLFIFPAISTFLSILYLSWLNKTDVMNILMSNGIEYNDFSSLSWWLAFLPLIIFRLYSMNKLDASKFFVRNFGIIIPFVAHFILILFDRSYPLDTYISIALLLTFFSMMSSQTKSRTLVLASFYLLVTSWFSLRITQTTQTKSFFNSIFTGREYKQGQDYELQEWLLSQKSEKTIIVSGDVYRTTHLNENFDDITTPYTKLYNQKINNIPEEFDRIVVSRTDLDLIPTTHPLEQRDLYSNPPYNFYHVFGNGKWKVYQRAGLNSRVTTKKQSLKEIFAENFMKDLLYLIIVFDLLLIGWKFINKRSKREEYLTRTIS